MKIVAILLLTITVTYQLQLEKNIFAQMTDNNPFGQAVLSMAQLTIQSTAPSGQLEAIRDLLGEIQGELDSLKESYTANYDAGQAMCSLSLGQLETELAGLKATQQDTQQEKDELEEERISKTSELADKRSNLVQDSADLESYKKQLEQENTVFDEQSRNFQDAINACDEAIKLLGQILIQSHSVSFAQSGSFFVQLSQKFENVKSILQNLEEKSTPNAFIQPIIDVLVQLGSDSKINSEQVKEIVSLITSLRDRLLAGLSQRQEAHVTNQENLEKLIADLQQQVNEHSKQVQNFETRITGVQDGMSQKDRILATANEMVVLKGALVASTKADCDQQIEESSSQLVQKLIEYFEDQIVSSVVRAQNNDDDEESF